jgi:hypothetical protein
MVSRQVYDDLEKGLKELYAAVSSPPAGLRPARAKMLAEAADLRARQASRPLYTTETGHIRRRRKMNLMFAYKTLAAVLAVAVAIAGMGGGVVLAADTLPGDFLYPVKLLSEEVKLALTPDPAGRAELEMAFVALRVQEMARLAQQGEDVPGAVVARMTRQMEQAMVEIAKARPEEVPALLERVMERTRLHQQVLEDVAAGSTLETQTRLREASQVMERTRQRAENDPMYLDYQYQHRYEGTPGSHGEASPPPSGAGQQTQEQEQNQHGYQGTQGPHGEATSTPQQEQVRQEEQHRYEGTAGPHGQATPTPTLEPVDTSVPEETTPPDTDPEQAQEEHQYRQEGTPGPHGEQSPPSGDEPEPTRTQQGCNSDKGH